MRIPMPKSKGIEALFLQQEFHDRRPPKGLGRRKLSLPVWLREIIYLTALALGALAIVHLVIGAIIVPVLIVIEAFHNMGH